MEDQKNETALVPAKASGSLDRLSYDLLHPRSALSPDIEERLFGNAIDTLGFGEDATYLISEIQYSFLIQIYEALGQAVQEGRLEEVKPTLRYFLQDIGNRLVAVLARAQQHYSEKERSFREKRGKWPLWRGPEEKRCYQEAEHLKSVIEGIKQGRDRLKGVLIEVIEQDRAFDSILVVKKAADSLLFGLDQALAKIKSADRAIRNPYIPRTELGVKHNSKSDYIDGVRPSFSKAMAQMYAFAELSRSCAEPEIKADIHRMVNLFDPAKAQGEPIDINYSMDGDLLKAGALLELLRGMLLNILEKINRVVARLRSERLGDILGNSEK